MPVVGFTGKMGSGKTTAGDRLAVLLPGEVRRIEYAAKLKESVAALFGLDIEDVERWKNDPAARVSIVAPDAGGWPVVAREMPWRMFLQRYGVESHRDVLGEHVWVDLVLPERDYSDALYVVTDVRFENEAARVRRLGGKVVVIEGPEEPWGVSLARAHRGHTSEAGVAFPDDRIDNSERGDGFAQLDRELLALMDRIGPALGVRGGA